ncbi:FimV/HubP family polar landmark protein [Pseudomonas coleopterorum]|uniref:FimV/HubP family polar landmark protein n=1 Tax=Pseudomonas coleopterorum TaxID=1605838 RepID=UPI002A69CE36|nr:FimV/HubP family polar landmark protein [Pseudomonas coleopterorum]MDY1016767.1 FimV/HubP family polar landmark protein [Pseudomonas coleopterorum]
MQVRIPSRSRFASLRLLAPVWALALCYSTSASALGLGELTLRSSLNQPFRADIALLDTAGLEQDDINASLATAEEFARAGVERSFFLNDLKFTPDFSGGRKVIHVSSSKVVTEPFMSFVIQVGRPNGQLLRAFTVLLDPPGMGPGLADRAPQRTPVAQANTQRPAEAPAKPRTASQPANEPARQPSAKAAAPAPSQDAAQLAAAALENQQLQKNFDDVQARLQSLEAQVADKDKEVAQLQARLAETPAASPPAVVPGTATATPAPVASPAPAAPVSAPAPVAAPALTAAEDSSGWLNILALVAALLLIIALLLLLRRQRQRKSAASLAAFEPVVTQPVQPAPPATAAAPTVVEAAPPKRAEPAPVPRREAPTATDALDGASIYIAYGRFNEALGILRDGLARQPERTDLRVRMLEVLGQQGNAKGFAEQEALLLSAGFDTQTLSEIRGRFPNLQPAPAPSSPAATAPASLAPTAATAVLAANATAAAAATAAAPVHSEPQPAPESAPEVDFDLSDFDLDAFDAPAEAVPTTQQDDEFQLNLDDLSMDADWALVSPFGDTPAPKSKPVAVPMAEEAMDPEFTSNLKELPEVFEMPEEQFLSDFAEVEELPPIEEPQTEDVSAGKSQEDIDNEFLDSFIADSDLPELDALTVDFDDLEQQHASAQKLDQAQQLFDEGDADEASALLHELLEDGDESSKQAARQLLARMGEA